jgi:hypothetical protein
LVTADGYTVRRAVEDWLTFGLTDRDEATKITNRYLCDKHVLPLLGARKLRDLTAPQVDALLVGLSGTMISRRRALALVPGLDPAEWTPRELRHTFVSLVVGCWRAA